MVETLRALAAKMLGKGDAATLKMNEMKARALANLTQLREFVTIGPNPTDKQPQTLQDIITVIADKLPEAINAMADTPYRGDDNTPASAFEFTIGFDDHPHDKQRDMHYLSDKQLLLIWRVGADAYVYTTTSRTVRLPT